jgi:hypothetical protein
MDFNQALKRRFGFKGGRPGGVSCPLALYGRQDRKSKRTYRGTLSLAQMARDMEARTGVEVGTYLGDWAKRWCQSNPALHLTCVDPYRVYNARPSAETQEQIYQTALKNLEPYNATIVRKASMDAVGDFADGSLDFVSIDGDHFFDAVVMDLVCWCPKVRKGGFVCVHDYTSNQGPHVIMAVNAYTHCHCINPWYATMDWTPTVFWEAT